MDGQTIKWMMDRWITTLTYILFDISSFSRLIAPVNTSDDHNLNEPLYQLYGMRMNSDGGKLFLVSSLTTFLMKDCQQLVLQLLILFSCLFFFLGPSTSPLAQHDSTPEISTERVILTNSTGAETSDFPRRSLIKVHGKFCCHADKLTK